MTVGLSTPTYDTSGALLIHEHKPETKLSEPAARVSRKKTLDGGVHIEHSGISDGDRNIVVAFRDPSTTDYDRLQHIYRNYTSITVACREGVFKGTIEKMPMRGNTVYVHILPEEKLSD